VAAFYLVLLAFSFYFLTDLKHLKRMKRKEKTMKLTPLNNLPEIRSIAGLEYIYSWLSGKPDTTKKGYYKSLTDFLLFVNKSPYEVSAFDVCRYYENCLKPTYSNSSIGLKISALSSFFNYLMKPNGIEKPLMTFNPVDGLDRKEFKSSPYGKSKKMTALQFQAVEKQINLKRLSGLRDKLYFRWLVFTGKRRSAVLKLDLSDIAFEDETIFVKYQDKGGNGQTRQLPDPVAAMLIEYLKKTNRQDEKSGSVFLIHNQGKNSSRKRNDLRPSGVNMIKRLKRYMRLAGLGEDVTLHSLRHLGADLEYQATGDVMKVMDFLGHSHLNTTQIYLSRISPAIDETWQRKAEILWQS
jgi:integrase